MGATCWGWARPTRPLPTPFPCSGRFARAAKELCVAETAICDAICVAKEKVVEMREPRTTSPPNGVPEPEELSEIEKRRIENMANNQAVIDALLADPDAGKWSQKCVCTTGSCAPTPYTPPCFVYTPPCFVYTLSCFVYTQTINVYAQAREVEMGAVYTFMLCVYTLETSRVYTSAMHIHKRSRLSQVDPKAPRSAMAPTSRALRGRPCGQCIAHITWRPAAGGPGPSPVPQITGHCVWSERRRACPWRTVSPPPRTQAVCQTPPVLRCTRFTRTS